MLGSWDEASTRVMLPLKRRKDRTLDNQYDGFKLPLLVTCRLMEMAWNGAQAGRSVQDIQPESCPRV